MGEAPSAPRRRVLRAAVLPIAILGLMIASFAAGRLPLHSNRLPAIVATLPGDESQFSRELDARIRERFPVGSSEDKLLEFLVDEGFAPQWRRRDGPNEGFFRRQGLLCSQIVRIFWRVDATGVLADVWGNYQSTCGSPAVSPG